MAKLFGDANPREIPAEVSPAEMCTLNLQGRLHLTQGALERVADDMSPRYRCLSLHQAQQLHHYPFYLLMHKIYLKKCSAA